MFPYGPDGSYHLWGDEDYDEAFVDSGDYSTRNDRYRYDPKKAPVDKDRIKRRIARLKNKPL